MALQAIIFLVLGVTIFILTVINVFLLWNFFQNNKKLDALLEKGTVKDLKSALLRQKDKNCDLDEDIKKAFLKIKDLEDISKRTIQKTGVVRFNPFNNMGGNQSFVIALLDDKNNGFVISSLFVKEGNRVYAKSIKHGKSEHTLSKEEVEAIDNAIKS